MLRVRTRARFGGTKWFNSSALKADGISPTLALDFKNNRYASNGAARSMTDIMTYSRGSTATYVGSDGLLKTAAINEQRRAYDPATLAFKGAMHETSAQNLTIYNRDTSGAGWGRTDITVNPTYGTAPDGTTTSNLITEGTAGTAILNQSINITSGSTYTHSVFLKYNNHPWVRLFFYDQTNSVNQVRVWVNLQTGALGTVQASAPATNAAARITAYPNGFYRVSISGILSTATSVFASLASATADAVTTRQNNAAYEVWGFQFELGTFMSSFIPTSATTVSRSADFFKTSIASYLTRASTATYRSYDGVLTTALADEPRYQYASPFPSASASPLIEGSVTNNASSTYGATFMTYTAASATGPDNVANSAGTATTDVALNNHFIGNSLLPIVTIGQYYCVSAFVKYASGSQYVQLAATASAADLNFYVNYDISTGVQTFAGAAVISSGIEAYTGGWYRIWGVFQAIAGGGGTACVVASIPASGSSRLASFTGSNSFYIYGMQHELGSAPTSYIPTAAAAVTRAADIIPNASSNLLIRTSAMTNAAWFKNGCSATDAQTDPYGTALACLITDSAAVDSYVLQTYTTTSHANQAFTFSVWLKTGTKTGNINIQIKDSVSTLVTQAVTPTATWTKYSVTGTFGASPAANVVVVINPVDTTAGNYYVYGAQLEFGSVATPTIITSTVNAPSVGAYNFMSEASGTMLIDFEYESGSGTSYPMLMRFDDFASANRINIYYNMSGTIVGSDAQVSSSSQYGFSSSKSASYIDTAKYANAWRTNNARAADEGTLLGADDTSCTVPNVAELLVADAPGGCVAYIKEARYYPHRISNPELQRITTP